MNAQAISVRMQKNSAPVIPNFENIHTINKIRGIAITEPINAVLNKGNSEFLQTTLIIPAIRGHTIKSANAADVNNNSFPIFFF